MAAPSSVENQSHVSNSLVLLRGYDVRRAAQHTNFVQLQQEVLCVLLVQ